MKKYKIAVIRVVTIHDENEKNIHGRLIESYIPNVETTSYCILDQPNGVYDDASHATAEIKIVELAKKLEDDYDGIIVSCAGDPGVEKLKKILKKPVVGAGHSMAMIGKNTGKTVGVLGIREDAPKGIVKDLGENLIVSKKVKNVNNTIELTSTEGEKNAIATAKEIEEKGVGLIILACTGMSTTAIAKKIKENVSIAVIDPVLAESLVMYTMLKIN